MLFLLVQLALSLKAGSGRFPVVVSGARRAGKGTLLKHGSGSRTQLVGFDPVQGIADARGTKGFLDALPRLDIAQGLVAAPCERFERISELDYALPWDLVLT